MFLISTVLSCVSLGTAIGGTLGTAVATLTGTSVATGAAAGTVGGACVGLAAAVEEIGSCASELAQY